MASGERASGKLIYDIGINDAQMLRSLRTISSEIRNTNNTWKAQATTLKANGQEAEALRAKIEGLNDVVKQQERYNSQLAHSLDISKKNRDTDNRTQEQWGAKLSQGTARLAKQKAQLQLASQAMVRYSTNIQEVTKEHRASKNEIKSNIDALKSEGNSTKATSEQARLYGIRISDLKDELGREEIALKAMTRSGQDNTVVVKEQETRINKLKTSLNLAKDSQHRFALGLDDINQKNKNFESITGSFVNKLKAQGREFSAQVVDLKRLKASVSGLNTQYKKEQEQLTYVKNKFGQTSKQYADQATKVNELSTKIYTANKRIGSLNSSIGGASKRTIAFGDRLGVLKDHMTRVGDAALQLSKGAGLASLGLGYMVKNGISQATRLQKSFVKSKNLLVTSNNETNANINKNMEKMKEQARSLSVTYGQSQYKIAQAQQELIKRGYTSNETIAAMKPLLQAAASSGDNLNNVMRVSTNALESFGLRTSNTGKMVHNTTKAVNEMAYASDMTSSNFADTGIAMSYVGATAHTAGIKMSETAAAIGILSNNGLEADKSGTGLRKTISSLISPTAVAKSMLDKYNITLQDSKGKMLPIATIFKEFHNRLKGLSKVKQMNIIHTIFGQTGQATAALLMDNADKLKKLNDQVARSNKLNYVQRLSRKNMRNAETQEKKFIQAFHAVEIELAVDFLPLISKVSKWTAGILNAVSKMSPTTKRIIDIVAIGLPTIAAFSAGFGFVSKNIRNIFTGFVRFKSFFSKSTDEQDGQITEQTDLIKAQIDAVDQLAASWQAVNDAQNGGSVEDIGKNDIPEKGTDNVEAVEKDTGKGSKVGNIAKETKEMGNIEKDASKEHLGFLGKLKGVFKSGSLKFFGVFSKVLSIGAWLPVISDTFKSGLNIFKDGVNSKKGGQSLWNIAGTTVGAGFGALVGQAGLGAMLGDEFTKKVKVADFVRWGHRTKAQQREVDAHNPYKKVDKYGTPGLVSGGESTWQQDATEVGSGVKGHSVKAFESNLNKAEKRIPEQVRRMASKVKGELNKSLVDFDEMAGTSSNKSIKSILSHNSSIYKSIMGQEKSYVSQQESKSKKDLNSLVKQGFMDKSEEKYALNRGKKYYNQNLSDSKSSLKKLANVDKRFAKEMEDENKQHHEVLSRTNKKYNKETISLESKRNSLIGKLTRGYYVKYHGQYLEGESGILKIKKAYAKKIAKAQKEQNDTIRSENKRHQQVMTADERAENKKRLSAMMKAEAKTSLVLSRNSYVQKKIMTKLKKDSGKISDSMASKLISNSYKTMKSTIKNADHTYNKTVASAKKKRNKVIGEAQEEFFVNHTINKRQYNDIVGSANNTYNDTVSAAKKQRKGVKKQAEQQHAQVVNEANKQSKDLFKTTGKQVSGLEQDWDGFKKSIGKIWSSITSTIGGWLGGIGKKLNKSFKAQNSAFGQYGGNGKTLSTVPEHYAAGTGLFSGSFRRAITKPTLAVLNDGNDSPETGNKETLIHPNGKAEVIQGRNTTRLLEPGAEIANATETKALKDMGIVHFASGTGILGGIGNFFKGVWGSLKQKLSALSKISKNSDKTWKQIFHPDSSGLKGSVSKEIMGLYKSHLDKQGSAWWSTAWNMMHGAANGGGSGAGGSWRHSPGLKESDPFGASRARMYGAGAKHDGVDFSGPLGSAIRAVHGGKVVKTGGTGISDLGKVIIVKSDDGFEEIYQEFGGMKNIKVGVGDTIRTGQKIATLGQLNGAGDGPHVHIGVTRGNPLKENMLSTHGWYDVTKLHGSHISKKAKKATSGLTKLVNKQLKNSGVLGWIKKYLAPLWNKIFGNIGNFKLGGDFAERAKPLAKAFKKAYPAATRGGIAGVLGNWIQESGLNPSTIDSADHGSGLGQWTNVPVGSSRGRETNMRNWLRKHGYRWDSAAGQIEYALREPGESGMLRKALRMSSPTDAAEYFFRTWESGGNEDNSGPKRYSNARDVYRWIKGYSNGGLVTQAQLAHVAEKNKPEMILPLTNKSRTVQLAREALEMVAGNDVKASASTESTKEIKTQNKELIKQNKTIISLLKSLVVASQNPIPAIVSGNDVVNKVNKHVRKKRIKNNLGRGVPLNEQ